MINWKVELKLKWTKYYDLSATRTNDADANPDNIIFAVKDTKLYVPVVTLSERNNQILSKSFSKDLNNQFIGMNIKQKVKIKTRQMNIVFSWIKFCWSQ